MKRSNELNLSIILIENRILYKIQFDMIHHFPIYFILLFKKLDLLHIEILNILESNKFLV